MGTMNEEVSACPWLYCWSDRSARIFAVTCRHTWELLKIGIPAIRGGANHEHAFWVLTI